MILMNINQGGGKEGEKATPNLKMICICPWVNDKLSVVSCFLMVRFTYV